MFGILAIYCSFLASHIGLIEHSRRVLEQPKTLCGEGEIRTRGDVAATLVFKTNALGHYATSPIFSYLYRFPLFRQRRTGSGNDKKHVCRKPNLPRAGSIQLRILKERWFTTARFASSRISCILPDFV